MHSVDEHQISADKQDEVLIRNAASRILAKREHSKHELVQKLLTRGFIVSLVERIADEFASQNLQSDQRYAESVLRGALSKGHGPQRISNQLKLSQVSDDIKREIIGSTDIDWFELALSVKIKKFGEPVEQDWHQRQKQQRFLLSRGFNFEQINFAVTHITDLDA